MAERYVTAQSSRTACTVEREPERSHHHEEVSDSTIAMPRPAMAEEAARKARGWVAAPPSLTDIRRPPSSSCQLTTSFSSANGRAWRTAFATSSEITTRASSIVSGEAPCSTSQLRSRCRATATEVAAKGRGNVTGARPARSWLAPTVSPFAPSEPPVSPSFPRPHRAKHRTRAQGTRAARSSARDAVRHRVEVGQSGGRLVGDDGLDAELRTEVEVGGVIDGPHVHPSPGPGQLVSEPGVLPQKVDPRSGDPALGDDVLGLRPGHQSLHELDDVDLRCELLHPVQRDPGEAHHSDRRSSPSPVEVAQQVDEAALDQPAVPGR